MMLSEPQRRFLIHEQTIAPAIVNFVLNTAIAWLVFRPHGAVHLWGNPGLVSDIVSTMFLLPLITCVVTTALVKRAVKSAKLPALSWGPSEHPLLRWLPSSMFSRGVALGVLTAVVIAPIALSAVLPLHLESFPVLTFAIAKGILCSVVAIVITPLVALYALAQASLPAVASPAR